MSSTDFGIITENKKRALWIDNKLIYASSVHLPLKIRPHLKRKMPEWIIYNNWAASSEFGIYRLCEQRRFRRACASAKSRQHLRCSLIQEVSQEEPSDRMSDPWPLWMAGHTQLKFVMTECSKTQIRLTRRNLCMASAQNVLQYCTLISAKLPSLKHCQIWKPE